MRQLYFYLKYLSAIFNLLKDHFILQYYSPHLAICRGFNLSEVDVKTKRKGFLLNFNSESPDNRHSNSDLFVNLCSTFESLRSEELLFLYIR